MSKFKEGLMRIQNCETDVECPADSDDPCAECRTEQTINLIASSLPKPKTLSTWDYYNELKKELEG